MFQLVCTGNCLSLSSCINKKLKTHKNPRNWRGETKKFMYIYWMKKCRCTAHKLLSGKLSQVVQRLECNNARSHELNKYASFIRLVAGVFYSVLIVRVNRRQSGKKAETKGTWTRKKTSTFLNVFVLVEWWYINLIAKQIMADILIRKLL